MRRESNSPSAAHERKGEEMAREGEYSRGAAVLIRKGQAMLMGVAWMAHCGGVVATAELDRRCASE